MNPNWDFSQGVRWWNPHYGGELEGAQWGYQIAPGHYGAISLDNPNLNNWPNAAMPQEVILKGRLLGSVPLEEWHLRDRQFILEADVLVNEDAPHDTKGWSRVAIVIGTRRIDGKFYDIRGRRAFTLYTEYDVYRRNVRWEGYEDWKYGPTDSYEYHAEQLPLGSWKSCVIDVSEFLRNGFKNIGGWGDEIYNMSRIQTWYLAIENTAASTRAAWRRVKIYRR
jgi:hypothetical protein